MKGLSSGSTLLNLALTGHANVGFLPGHYYFLVGDSDSGKTFLSMTCMAEATIDPAFKDHRLIYDNVEDGMLMDCDRLFNEQMADRLEPPKAHKQEPAFSSTIEEFYYNVDDALGDGRPFIYILDSMDALDSESAGKKFDQRKKAFTRQQARARGEDVEGKADEDKIAGSYGDGKAKMNSENLRKVMSRLRKTQSILIVISQTRDNLGGYGRTRAGGRALRFYATCELWSSVAQKLYKDVNGIKREIGTRVELQGRKNRVTGRNATVELDIYPSSGIDDVGACVDYLVEEGHWTKSKMTIDAKGLGISGTREKVIRLIEKRGLEEKLRASCAECWHGVLEACSVQRKSRYAIEDTHANAE